MSHLRLDNVNTSYDFNIVLILGTCVAVADHNSIRLHTNRLIFSLSQVSFDAVMQKDSKNFRLKSKVQVIKGNYTPSYPTRGTLPLYLV